MRSWDGKSWLSEHLAAAVCGTSTLTIQGTTGTTEEHIKYSWNIARVIAEGPRPENLIPLPTMLAMRAGALLRFEEITRCVPDVQDALVSILSDKAIVIPELPDANMVWAKSGFNIIATANTTVVPYSYFRVSELSGYAAGNRAPQFYQTAWDLARAGRGDELLAEHVVATLHRARREGEPLSSAAVQQDHRRQVAEGRHGSSRLHSRKTGRVHGGDHSRLSSQAVRVAGDPQFSRDFEAFPLLETCSAQHWIRELRGHPWERESSWSGVMTLPRILSLGADGTLRIKPVPELEVLRSNPRQHQNVQLGASSEKILEDVQGECLELALEIEPGAAGRCGVRLRCSPDGAEQTVVACAPAAKKPAIEMGKSSLDPRIR